MQKEIINQLKGSTVIIIDDNSETLGVLYHILTHSGMNILLAQTGTDAIRILNETTIDLILLDIRLPDMDGFEVCKQLKLNPKTKNIPIIFISVISEINDKIKAFQMGGVDYIPKPFSIARLHEIVEKSIVAHNGRRESDSKIISADPQMLKILRTIEIVANADNRASVLIQGESGTGKELIAKEIHERDRKRNGLFIAVNCAAMPESLLESELFGHEQGSFTGAIARRIGKFEVAHNGTLLLDEIAEMPSSLQVKLLRVLQEGEIDRIGSNETIKVDVRVIATTNRNIKEEVEEGKFRDDLFYRLYVVPIIIPPLRARRDDIPILVDHFLARFARETGKESLNVSQEAIDALRAYNWPGNVRELENLVKRAVMFSSSNVLSTSDFFSNSSPDHPLMEPPWSVAGTTLYEAEKYLIMNTLKQVNGNKTRAAKILDVTPRTIRNKLQQYLQEQSRTQ